MTHEELLEGLKRVYKLFQEGKHIMWAGEDIGAGEDIETREQLLGKFREVASEEEIASIVKGEE